MTIGTVKWFNTQKGYGFIQPEDGSKDVFVHISAVERSGLGHLVEGQRISYQLERGQQGKTSAVGVDPVRWTVCHLGCFGFLEHLHLIGNRG